MSERFRTISRLLKDVKYRGSYVRTKLAVVVPSQIRALRGDLTQQELAELAGMKQSRISAIETPGAVNFNLETLVRLASALGVGLWVEFVSYSEMLRRENKYSQDSFTVVPVGEDKEFLNPPNQSQTSGTFELRPGRTMTLTSPYVSGIVADTLSDTSVVQGKTVFEPAHVAIYQLSQTA
jgi:transcriptional regulator with XRE-family HTH domain